MVKICLAANSGGHLNQLLQLKDFYKKHDYFFVTNENEFSKGLKKQDNVYFVKEFILKEIENNFDILSPIDNFVQSLRIFLKEKPDLIITTGAGTAFGMCILSKIFGKKLIFK